MEEEVQNMSISAKKPSQSYISVYLILERLSSRIRSRKKWNKYWNNQLLPNYQLRIR